MEFLNGFLDFWMSTITAFSMDSYELGTWAGAISVGAILVVLILLVIGITAHYSDKSDSIY